MRPLFYTVEHKKIKFNIHAPTETNDLSPKIQHIAHQTALI